MRKILGFIAKYEKYAYYLAATIFSFACIIIGFSLSLNSEQANQYSDLLNLWALLASLFVLIVEIAYCRKRRKVHTEPNFDKKVSAWRYITLFVVYVASLGIAVYVQKMISTLWLSTNGFAFIAMGLSVYTLFVSVDV